ncbi:TetR/AcrR family transcriptional regulator [Sphingopyxis chilensis]|uniref:TetR/AcrR family transcriptional regulator n=1 Tax=Sphingopyxis chilensis TaxID=180400 RepID=UPI002DDD2976|nr:TetR/AcrR family transcriptional regulator [Sphingopyxis chilensis]
MARYARGHKDASRDKIVSHASARLRKEGIAAVGVRTLMAEAGLTHGAFYTHFPARSDLVVAAIDHALDSAAAHLRHIVEQAPAGRGLEALVRSYLSIGHRDRAELGCAASALAPEIARESLPARESFMRRTREMTELIASTLPADWAADIRTERGYAIFASMMGSLQLMRTASDPAEIEAIMMGGRKAALLLAEAQ